MLDEAIDSLETLREQPVWRPVPDAIKEKFDAALPVEGTPLDAVYEDFRREIQPYAMGNSHPRFFGWVNGAGQPGNVLAEMLAAAMNPNCGGRDHGAIHVERQILEWCRQIFGFPESASGLLVSGTSMANLVALAVARHAAEPEVRTQGIAAGELVAYVSAEAHESIARALEVLGLGSASLRKIGVHEDFTIDVEALREAIAVDRAAGMRPVCVVGCAGTVNTGAIDDLDALARLCGEEHIWFHIDGAFGALAILSDAERPRLHGIERADSLAFDFHKWLHVQYDAGCVLIRDGGLHRAAFSIRPAYLEALPRGLGAGGDWPWELGPELSRGFRALKVWFAMREHGLRKLGALIELNCRQAAWLSERIAAEPDLQLLAPATLNIVCFRYRAEGLSERELDRLNEDIVADVQEAGIAAPSTSRIHGHRAIRVCVTNHRTRTEDLDTLLQALLTAGRRRTALCADAAR